MSQNITLLIPQTFPMLKNIYIRIRPKGLILLMSSNSSNSLRQSTKYVMQLTKCCQSCSVTDFELHKSKVQLMHFDNYIYVN